MNKYGKLPTVIDTVNVQGKEFLFYQDMPIKLADSFPVQFEQRLGQFAELIFTAREDFLRLQGHDGYMKSYMYLTAKRMFQPAGSFITRPGWHTDGFGTDDITYIWYDCNPTLFCKYDGFKISDDDRLSMKEMQDQAEYGEVVQYDPKTLLRLDQYVVHQPRKSIVDCVRTFAKIVFSRDKFDLEGNTNNYTLDYVWPMRKRSTDRNVPQNMAP